MKSNFKKAVALIAATIMTFSMYSCGSINDDTKNSSEKTDVTTTIVSTESEETTDTSENASEASDDSQAADSEAEEDIDVDSLKYDFEGLKTEKYIKTFMSGKYKMVGQASQTGSGEEAYVDVDQNKMLLKIDYLGQDFSMYIDNGKQYTILGKSYFKGEDNNMLESIAPYKNCGYVKSGEKEIDGTTYYFDEYYDVDKSSSMKLIVDKDGKLYGMEEQNVTTAISELTPEFDESVFNVLEGCQETTEEEFYNALMGSSKDSAPAE